MADARTAKRFPLTLPIRFEDPDRGLRLVGETDNLSGSGVHILLAAELKIGSDVEFDMTIPAAAIGTSKDVVVHCRGRVVRNDHGDESEPKPGVACVIDTYEFLRAVEDSGK